MSAFNIQEPPCQGFYLYILKHLRHGGQRKQPKNLKPGSEMYHDNALTQWEFLA